MALTKEEQEKYKWLTMNELRIWLYEAGVDWPDDASREDLIRLYEKTLKS